MILIKQSLYFSLLFLSACNSVSLSNIQWKEDMLELELGLDDGLGLIVLQPIRSAKVDSASSVVKSLRFLCKEDSIFCGKSILVVSNTSLYGKINQNSCVHAMSKECKVLKRSWLAIYRPGDQSIITYPYDNARKKQWHAEN